VTVHLSFLRSPVMRAIRTADTLTIGLQAATDTDTDTDGVGLVAAVEAPAGTPAHPCGVGV
jgi:hypothetical protein